MVGSPTAIPQQWGLLCNYHGRCCLASGPQLESSPRQSPAPPCLQPRGIHPWTQTMLLLPKDHPRVPRMPPSPSPPSPAARRDCRSPLASLSAGHCKEKKGRGREAELLHSPVFPCSGLHDEDAGLNLHPSLREGLFSPAYATARPVSQTAFSQALSSCGQPKCEEPCLLCSGQLGDSLLVPRGLGANVCLGQGCIWSLPPHFGIQVQSPHFSVFPISAPLLPST